MSLTHPSLADQEPGAGLPSHTPTSASQAREETIRSPREIDDESRQEAQLDQSKTLVTEEGQHVTFNAPSPTDPSTQFADTGSTYYSARSRISFRSIFTRSTGPRSQRGATWLQALTRTMNSGFGSSRVTEGRERGGYLPRITGVGRTGKAPAPVPASMLKALSGVVTEALEPQPEPSTMCMLESLQFSKTGIRAFHDNLHGYDSVHGSPGSAACDTSKETLLRARYLPFYGLTLEDLRRRDGSLVPSVILRLMRIIESNAFRLERLYDRGIVGRGEGTASGMSHEIFMGLRNNDVSPLESYDFSTPGGFSIEWVTELLLRFFKQLPDPLLTVPYYQTWLKAVDTEDESKEIEQARALATNLPEANFATLRALAQHDRKLTAENPNLTLYLMYIVLMWGAGGYDEKHSAEEEALGYRVLQVIFENYDEIFGADGAGEY